MRGMHEVLGSGLRLGEFAGFLRGSILAQHLTHLSVSVSLSSRESLAPISMLFANGRKVCRCSM
jgi:hypothetical protein